MVTLDKGFVMTVYDIERHRSATIDGERAVLRPLNGGSPGVCNFVMVFAYNRPALCAEFHIDTVRKVLETGNGAFKTA